MSRRKHYKLLRYLLAAAIAGAAAAWLLLNGEGLLKGVSTSSTSLSPETGYKAEDRKKLEQLIHEGTKND